MSDVSTVSKFPGELESGDVLVGDFGGQASITGEVYASNTLSGFFAVEVEFGTLYLDADLTVEVLVS